MYVNSYSFIGGAEKSLQSIILGIEKKGVYPILVLGTDGPMSKWAERNNILTYIIPQPTLKSRNIFLVLLRLSQFLSSILKVIYNHKVSIVHTNTLRSRLYCIPLTLLPFIRTVAHVRDIEPLRINYLLVLMYTKTIAISDAVMASLGKISANHHKVIKINNGIELREYDLPNHSKSSIIKFVMLGRFVPWKGHALLIESILMLREQGISNFCLKIYGSTNNAHEDRYLEKLKNSVKNNKLSQHVIFEGYTDNPQKMIQESDLLICPSFDEPFGRVVIEAMMLKKPVIASLGGGILEILGSRLGNAYGFKQGSVESLHMKLKMYCMDPADFEQEVEYAFSRYKEKFSIESLLANLDSLYKSIK